MHGTRNVAFRDILRRIGRDVAPRRGAGCEPETGGRTARAGAPDRAPAPRRPRGWRGRLLSRAMTPAPRGFGTAAVLLLAAATAAYGAVRGGHMERVQDELLFLGDGMARRVGLGIASVRIDGLKELKPWQVLEALDMDETRSLLLLDAGQARRKLEGLPLIRRASVRKLYPGTLRIEVEERTPFALWQKDGVLHVVDADGAVIDRAGDERYEGLPVVVGAGAERQARALFEALLKFPDLAGRLQAATRVADRRWNLRLGGVDVRLPDGDLDAALAALDGLQKSIRVLDRDVQAVDLRTPNRVAVRLTDAAAQRFHAAVKEREKRRKGGSA
jgi:cell division protein FtsQ